MYEIIMVVESQIATSAIFVTGPAKTGYTCTNYTSLKMVLFRSLFMMNTFCNCYLLFSMSHKNVRYRS